MSTDLIRLIQHADAVTKHLPHSTDAVALYRAAANHAEQVWPGDLGTALAGVLAIAAETREARRLRGMLGEHHATVALALAVLDRPTVQAGDGYTCPRCGRVSRNPNDIREGYCGACHDWTSIPGATS